MKKVLILIAAITISASVFAQDYDRAVGLRIGAGVSANYKTFLSSTNAFQVDLGLTNLFSKHSLNLLVSGTYLWHWGTEINRLSLYAGPGASVGLYLGQEKGEGEKSALALSVDALGGLEYTFKNLPMAISLDYRPQINLLNKPIFNFSGVGLGIKYTF